MTDGGVDGVNKGVGGATREESAKTVEDDVQRDGALRDRMCSRLNEEYI